MDWPQEPNLAIVGQSEKYNVFAGIQPQKSVTYYGMVNLLLHIMLVMVIWGESCRASKLGDAANLMGKYGAIP